MQVIEIAWKQFFRQFAPHVFTEGELVQDSTNTLYPRITFSYQMGEYFTNTLTTFQVWTWGFNNTQLWSVCDKIAEAVPIESGTALTISGKIYHEYFNPETDTWEQFEVADFQAIADRYFPLIIEWRRVESDSAGGIEIWRGNPFLTPSPKDEPLSRVMYGTLQARYLNII